MILEYNIELANTGKKIRDELRGKFHCNILVEEVTVKIGGEE